MTAAGIDALSNGRCVLGLGASGPQVIEGFHGVRYDKPLSAHTRDHRDMPAGVEARRPGEVPGACLPLPLPETEGTGLGKPLKLIAKPVRDRIPIHLAALGEKNVALAAELADGWLPLFYIPEKAKDVFGPSLEAGTAVRDPKLGKLDICAGGMVAITDDLDQARAIRDFARPLLALYIGGMGARGRNFYNALACRYGYESEANRSRICIWRAARMMLRPLCPRNCSSYVVMRARRLREGSDSSVRSGGCDHHERLTCRCGSCPLDRPASRVDELTARGSTPLAVFRGIAT